MVFFRQPHGSTTEVSDSVVSDSIVPPEPALRLNFGGCRLMGENRCSGTDQTKKQQVDLTVVLSAQKQSKNI